MNIVFFFVLSHAFFIHWSWAEGKIPPQQQEEILKNSHDHLAALLPGIQQLPIINLDSPISPFISDITSRGLPAIIRGGPNTLWRFPTDPGPNFELLGAELPEILRIHRPLKSFVRMHSRVAPMAQLLQVVWNRPWSEENVTFLQFMQEDKTLAYFMLNNDQLSETAKSWMMPNDWLTKELMPGSIYQTFYLLESNLWIGKPGITTPLHYDLANNFYAQIYGRKGFLLTSPALWHYFCLFPRIHPSSRMSQIPWDTFDTSTWTTTCPPFAQFLKAGQTDPNRFSELLFRAELEPGDLLFIPPYWGHHVTALEEVSVSISSHLGASLIQLREGLNSMVLDPGVKKTESIFPLTLYATLRSIFAHVQEDSGTTLSQFIDSLIEERYKPLQFDRDVKGLGDVLHRAEVLWETVPDFDQRIAPQFKRTANENAEKVSTLLVKFAKSSSWDIALIELGNWVEDNLAMFLGPERVSAYLNELQFYLNL